MSAFSALTRVLRQKLGEGGFGNVWMAEQSVPVARVVALKVIKAGMDTKQVLARFETERPEQGSLSGLDIDTRSDTYSRGILLYELLVGKPPFDGKSPVLAHSLLPQVSSLFLKPP